MRGGFAANKAKRETRNVKPTGRSPVLSLHHVLRLMSDARPASALANPSVIVSTRGASTNRMDSGIKVEMGFLQRRLPWILGGALFVFYLVTLSKSPTPSGALSLSHVLGWE